MVNGDRRRVTGDAVLEYSDVSSWNVKCDRHPEVSESFCGM